MNDSFFEQPGLSTRYRLEGDGPRLALIHGVGSSLESWDDVVVDLGQKFQLLRYDLRGLGESTKVSGRYELSDFVDDFAALMDHIGWSSCHVVGHSLGGLVAQGIALSHPHLVDKLVLSSTVAGRNADEIERVQERLRTVEGGIAGAHFRKSMDRWFTPEFREAHPDRIAKLEQRNLANDPTCYAAAYRVLAETDLADDLHSVKAQTLVMTGEHDIGSNPRMAALMHERIKSSKLVVLPGLRHSLLAEAPEVIAELLLDFLDA
jgi:pimeloyl-ACP methyl ester carboxylesterase